MSMQVCSRQVFAMHMAKEGYSRGCGTAIRHAIANNTKPAARGGVSPNATPLPILSEKDKAMRHTGSSSVCPFSLEYFHFEMLA